MFVDLFPRKPFPMTHASGVIRSLLALVILCKLREPKYRLITGWIGMILISYVPGTCYGVSFHGLIESNLHRLCRQRVHIRCLMFVNMIFLVTKKPMKKTSVTQDGRYNITPYIIPVQRISYNASTSALYWERISTRSARSIGKMPKLLFAFAVMSVLVLLMRPLLSASTTTFSHNYSVDERHGAPSSEKAMLICNSAESHTCVLRKSLYESLMQQKTI